MRRTILTPAWFSRIVNPCPYVVDFGHPITNQLNRVDLFNGVIYANPLYSKTGEVRSLTLFRSDGTSFRLGAAGVGLATNGSTVTGPGGTANGTDWRGVNAPILSAKGSIASYITTGPSDNAGHVMTDISQYPITNNGLSLQHDGTNWATGFYGTATQAVWAAAYPNNKTMTVGGTWDTVANTQSIYVDGLSRGTAASGLLQNTINYQYSIGAFYRTSGAPWGRSMFNNSYSRIYWVAIWDRVLSSAEIIYLNANPMCFLVPAEYEMPVSFFPFTPPSILYGHNIGASFTRKVTTIGY